MLIAPVIEIVPTGNALPHNPVDAILATSVHALTGIDRLPAALAGAPWLVVGERFRAALVSRKFGKPEVVATDVANLIDAVGERYPEPFRFLYLAGRDRKDTLERALRAAGHDLSLVETYAARGVDAFDARGVEALRNGLVDAVLHFSHRSAKLYVDRIRDAALTDFARHTRHIAISADAAAPIAAQGWPVGIAERPDEEAMLAMFG